MRRQGARLVPVDDISADELVRVPSDKDVLVKIVSHKNMKLFRMLWALAAKVADACDHLHDREDAMDELKIRTRYVKYITNPITGDVRIVPKSLTKLDGAGLNRLADRMIHVICRDIVPGMNQGALKAEIMKMIAGTDQPNSNSSEPDLPKVEAQASEPAEETTPPSSAGEIAEPSAPSLPQGWEITYAAALRRAQKVASLDKLAADWWKQYGGWDQHSCGPNAQTAAAIYNTFKTNFGNKDAIERELREIF